MTVGITDYHVLGPVQINSTVIGGITAAAVNNGHEIYGEPVSGEIGVRTQSITALKPGASFTTMDLAVALAACGSLGTDLSTANLHVFATKRTAAGAIASGAAHTKWLLRGGLLYPTRLTCDHRGQAQLSYEAQAVADADGNAPIVGPTTVSLPTGVNNNVWTLQSASFSGVGATDLRNAEVDFGFRVQTEGSNSELYDNQISYQLDPRLTIMGVTPAYADAVALLGESATCSITFRKRQNRGTFTADTLTLSATGLAHVSNPYQAGQRGAAQFAITVAVTFDGTNAPITVAAA